MSANNITQLCQKAAKALLDSENLSFITDNESQIVTGIATDELSLPMVVCQCAQAQAAVPYEGNWSASLRIEVRSNSDDTTQDEHHERSGEVFSKFMDSFVNERDLLSSATLGFTAQQVLPVRQGWEINDNSWVSYLELQVECYGSFVAEPTEEAAGGGSFTFDSTAKTFDSTIGTFDSTL